MKVAIFTDTFTPQVNGVARTLERWTLYLQKQGVEYRLFAPETKENDTYAANIHRFISMPFWLYPECRLAVPNVTTVKSELEQFNPDLVHIATPFNIGLTGLYFAKKLGFPLVGSYHTHFHRYLDYYGLSFLSPLIWKYMRWFHHSFRKTFVPSLETKAELERHGFSDISIWSRGVDSEHFHPNIHPDWLKKKYSIDAPHLLTYVGRLAPEKGLNVLMETAHRLPNHIAQNVHWLVVGDGPMYEELKKEAPENMTFTGYQTGRMLTQIYASSSALFFPSATETFGNVVLESLACGTPAIVAKAGGVQEIVKEQVTGYLCTPGDISDFTRAISTLIENPYQLQQMSEAARRYALTQNWEMIFKSLLLEYKEAVRDVREATYA